MLLRESTAQRHHTWCGNGFAPRQEGSCQVEMHVQVLSVCKVGAAHSLAALARVLAFMTSTDTSASASSRTSASSCSCLVSCVGAVVVAAVAAVAADAISAVGFVFLKE